MAITLGTPTNSGNLTAATTRTQSHICAANTKCLVVVVTGYDSSAADSAVSSITYNSVTVPQCEYYRSGSAFIAIHALPLPYIGTANIVVTMGGANTDLQVTAIGLISATASAIRYDNFAEGDSATTAHSLTVSPMITGAVTVGGIVDIQAAITALSVTTGTEIANSEADMGSQVVGCATGTTATITWAKTAAVSSSALVCSFYEQFVTYLAPTVGVLTITGFVPTVSKTNNTFITPTVGVLTITGFAPTTFVSVTTSVTPTVGDVLLDGFAPTVSKTNNITLSPIVGAIAITGFGPTVFVSYNAFITPTVGDVLLDGFAPEILIDPVPTFLTKVKSLQFSMDGSPWVRLAVSSSQNVDALKYSQDGSPWWGHKPPMIETWATFSIKVYVNGQWVAKPVKIYIGGTWVEKELKKL